MKTLIFTALFTLTTSAIIGQDKCKGFFAREEGARWTMTSYNKNKEKTGSIQYEVLFSEEENGAKVITFGYTGFDDEDAQLYAGEFTGACSDNNFTTSFSGTFGDIISQTANMEVEVSGDLVQYPHMMKAGDRLPDATVEMISKVENGLSLLKVSSEIFNRKVVGKETIITPAGSFECVKITYDAKVKLLLTKTISVVEYLGEDIGIVRSEQYDKKGNLSGYTELTSFTKP